MPDDFGDRLPPMLVKELRQGLRSRAFVGIFTITHVILAFCLIGLLATVVQDEVSAVRTSLDVFFWVATVVVLLILTPLRSLGAIQQERDGAALDLLLLSRLRPWSIVAGKWLALQAQSALFVLTLLPYGVVRYFVGGVEVGEEAFLFGTVVLFSGVLTALGTLGSTFSRALRIGLTVLLVVAGQPLLMLLGMSPLGDYLFGAGAVSGAGWGAVLEFGFLVAAFAGYGALSLHAAQAALAPPAYNTARFPRLLAWAYCLPVPLAALCDDDVFVAAVTFAVPVLVLTAVAGFCSTRRVLPIHLRGLERAPRLWRVVRLALLPGFPGALLWLLATVVGGLACAGIAVWMAPGQPWASDPGAALAGAVVVVASAVSALLFPALVAAWLNLQGRRAAGGYLLLVLLFSVPGVILANLPPWFGESVFHQFLSAVIPISSFWTALGAPREGLGDSVRLGVAVVLVALAVARALPQWRDQMRGDSRP